MTSAAILLTLVPELSGSAYPTACTPVLFAGIAITSYKSLRYLQRL